MMGRNPYLEKAAALLSPSTSKQIGSVVRSAKSFAGNVVHFGVKEFGTKTPLIKRLQQVH